MIEFLCLFNLTFLLDALLPEPPNSLHPVAWFGRIAGKIEHLCRRCFGNGIFSGAVAWMIMTLPLPIGIALMLRQLEQILPSAALAATIGICWVCIAMRSLSDHAKRIIRALSAQNLPAARLALSRIVTRDTASLNESEIVRGGIESVGENLIDAVTSPWFWMLLGFCSGGLPGAAAGAVFLRGVNTLDACWGYRNERYLLFGRVAARADDLIHWIPARLTMIAIGLAAPCVGGSLRETLRTGWKHRHDHPSPNSGFGMASFAGALGVRLGGPTLYHGELEPYPVWGNGRSLLVSNDLKRAKILAWGACMVFLFAMEGGYILCQRFCS